MTKHAPIMPDFSFVPGPDTARDYRDALGCYGTGVTVVTTQTASGPLAMTVNSFASVSLDPALVLWCPGKASPRHDRFIAAQTYAIHVMAENQLDMAAHFARTGEDFGTIDWTPSAAGVPQLSGCLARFDCTQVAVHDGGDHSIIIGRVDLAMHRPGKGLMFKRGQYGGFLGLD